MAAMLTCGEFRNEKRVASLTNTLRSRENAPRLRSRRGIRDRGIKEMRESHRHPARVSATFLPKDSSLYDAIRAIIGSELRSKLEVPKATPSYLDDLLKELDDRLHSDQLQRSTHSERPGNC